MNKSFQHSIFASFLSLLLCVIGISIIPDKKPDVLERKSICFILGEDKQNQDFYTLATEFFARDSVAKTDKLITHVRSIEQLLHFLNHNKEAKPWNRIELVVHGNVWSGLSTKILDGGERAYPKELFRAVIKKQLPILESNVIDTNTIINVWGCGIGTNPIMNIALEKCFTDEESNRPKLNASKKFVVFKRQRQSGNVRLVQASYWPYFFKRGYRPSESQIAKSLETQFPDAPVNFSDAIGSNDRSTVFQQSFHIPVSWTVIYDTKEERPSVGEEIEKLKWVTSQAGLMKKIREFGIPIERYQWTVNKIIHTDEFGQTVPAIKAIGMSTVLCVLEEEHKV